MKPRRVFVTLELETDVVLSVLRNPRTWHGLTSLACRPGGEMIVLQAQANVAVTRKEAFRVFDEREYTAAGRRWLRKFKKANADARKKARLKA